jgi:hypothetical protein
VLQWCNSGVAVLSQWCHSGVTVVLQCCHSGVTVVLQWGHSGICTRRPTTGAGRAPRHHLVQPIALLKRIDSGHSGVTVL